MMWLQEVTYFTANSGSPYTKGVQPAQTMTQVEYKNASRSCTDQEALRQRIQYRKGENDTVGMECGEGGRGKDVHKAQWKPYLGFAFFGIVMAEMLRRRLDLSPKEGKLSRSLILAVRLALYIPL